LIIRNHQADRTLRRTNRIAGTVYVGATRKVQQGVVERLGFLFDE
jgi:hypothetical protein